MHQPHFQVAAEVEGSAYLDVLLFDKSLDLDGAVAATDSNTRKVKMTIDSIILLC